MVGSFCCQEYVYVSTEQIHEPVFRFYVMSFDCVVFSLVQVISAPLLLGSKSVSVSDECRRNPTNQRFIIMGKSKGRGHERLSVLCCQYFFEAVWDVGVETGRWMSAGSCICFLGVGSENLSPKLIASPGRGYLGCP